ncbi:MAG: pyruvate ferredoxin oxidoreductase subunit gamma [Patescibacteria group bacterium]|nr:pyruvate ferredoxin oxidoreductase subunit gamma [Patescibacteria group bacterium]MDD5294411.1 pyruvate ferredoxin oxidoreductase subunit gamma [Patescibacteria group bacterium]MDD5554522.1 pyruvate ferredoxin oxidoreductase subunit gamma [Patescibacteria group bacterium]
MKQIRIHGRGGQGVVTAAELIAIAAFADGKEAQAFPSFGVERTGAPIESFARIDDKPIRIREHIYKPDVLIVQDPSLLNTVDITKGAGANTLVIINTTKNKNELKLNLKEENIYAVDATKIALEIIGKNIVNTVILGAFARATGLVSLDGLKKAITRKFTDKGKDVIEKNIKAVVKAYNA